MNDVAIAEWRIAVFHQFDRRKREEAGTVVWPQCNSRHLIMQRGH